MRIDSAGFAQINSLPERNPRFVIQVDFQGSPETEMWLTSHADCKVPDTVDTDNDVFYRYLGNISSTSQKLDPIKALSTIGTINFDVVDYNENITARIKQEYDSYNGLRERTVRVYVGEEGLDWDDYILVTTQIINKVSLEGGMYSFDCADVQRTIRKEIFDPELTNLLYNMDAEQTAFNVYDTSDFQTLVHGASYSVLPNETVGYVEVDKEIIAWRNKLETAISVTSSGISFSGSEITFVGSPIGSPLTDLSVFSAGQIIQISGSTSNDGSYYITSTGSPEGAPDSTTITVTGTFTTEATGADVTILADIQFYNCDRGVLNTKAAVHEMSDPLPTATDQRTKVTEVIYLELPIPKLIYAVLTGTLYGSVNTLPDGWHLNISTDFIQTADFINVGSDYWDTSDDTIGLRCRFVKPKKTDGKKFIEKELLLLGGFFMPVLSNGALGLRRMTRILSDSAYSKILNEDNVIKISELTHEMDKVYNRFNIEWNYNHEEKRYTRSQYLIDGDSITRHGAAKIYTMQFQGLHGTTHTQANLILQADSARDRYAGPPQEITVTCMYHCNDLEVGDIVRLQLTNLQDFVTGGSIDRSFEVQEVRTDWRKGDVTLKLFGSTQAAASIASTALATQLDSSFYTSAGVDLQTALAGSPSPYSVGGGTMTINADCSLYGGSTTSATAYSTGTVDVTLLSATVTGTGTSWSTQDIAWIKIAGTYRSVLEVVDDTTLTLTVPWLGASSSGESYETFGSIYYYDGDLVIDSGVTLTTYGNVQLRVNGSITYNGKIDTKGNGNQSLPVLTNSNFTEGVAGLGSTRAPGAIRWEGVIIWNALFSYQAPITEAKNGLESLPNLTIQGVGSPLGSELTGLDGWDFRGTAGGSGGRAYGPGAGSHVEKLKWGGQGGHGGGGLLIITQNMYAGVSGIIDLSGADGDDIIEPAIEYSHEDNYFYPGSGAGGMPGGLYVIVDGNGTIDFDGVVQNQGVTPTLQGARAHEGSSSSRGYYQPKKEGRHWHSWYEGNGYDVETDRFNSFHRIKYLGDIITPAIDTPAESSQPSLITLTEAGATSTTLNHTAIEIQVSAPTGSGADVDNYAGAHVYARNLSGSPISTSWYDVGVVGPTGELAYFVLADGSTWEIKAHSISKSGYENPDAYISDTITVGATLETVIGTGVSVSTGTDPSTNGGVTIDDSGLTAYNGSGTQKVNIDATTGVITAVDCDLTGTISANAGDIGGWDITSTTVVSPDGQLVLDSGNNRIRVYGSPVGNYIQMDDSGLTAVDTVLGTTVTIPTNGNAPTFSSGTINETTFEISTNGVMRTSSTVGSGSPDGAGVLINSNGVYGYEASNSTPNFVLSATDGKITARDAEISGTIVAGGSISSGMTEYLDPVNPGYWMEQAGGSPEVPRFSIGDYAAGKYFAYDGDVVIGENSQLKGAYGYDDNAFNDPIAGWNSSHGYSSKGGGSPVGYECDVLWPSGIVEVQVGIQPGQYATFTRQFADSTITDLDWDGQRRRWKCKFRTAGALESTVELYISTGSYNDGFGFFFDNSNCCSMFFNCSPSVW